MTATVPYTRVNYHSRPRTSGITATCRHCGRTRYLNSRRLCWPCRRQPAILSLYPSRAAPRGVPDFYGRGKVPAEATDARPWTPTSERAGGRSGRRTRSAGV